MRPLLFAPLALVAVASAQTWNEVARTRPEIAITVRETAGGTDSVEITPLNPDFPSDHLKDRALEIATSLGEQPRALLVQRLSFGSMAGRDPIQVTFGVDGLADRKAGWIRLSDLVRPFVADGVKGMTVIYEGFQPNANTVLDYKSAGVQMLASPQSGGIGAEFRIRISTTDPKGIDIPIRNELKPPATKVAAAPPKPDFFTYTLIVAAALALGALVYSLLLRPRSRLH